MSSFCIANTDNLCSLHSSLHRKGLWLFVQTTSIWLVLLIYFKTVFHFSYLRSFLYYFQSSTSFVFSLSFFSNLLRWTLSHSLFNLSIALKATNFYLHFSCICKLLHDVFSLIFSKMYFLISIFFDLQLHIFCLISRHLRLFSLSLYIGFQLNSTIVLK